MADPGYGNLWSRLDYNPITGAFIWKYAEFLPAGRNKRFAGKEAGSITKSGYRTINISGGQSTVLVFAHRLAFLFMLGCTLPPEVEVDHKNGKRADNRWDNLRPVTHSSNGKNKILSRANKSGFKGVSYRASCSLKWRAQILAEGEKISIGHFASARDAAIAYDERAIILHGQYAKTNKALGLL